MKKINKFTNLYNKIWNKMYNKEEKIDEIMLFINNFNYISKDYEEFTIYKYKIKDYLENPKILNEFIINESNNNISIFIKVVDEDTNFSYILSFMSFFHTSYTSFIKIIYEGIEDMLNLDHKINEIWIICWKGNNISIIKENEKHIK